MNLNENEISALMGQGAPTPTQPGVFNQQDVSALMSDPPPQGGGEPDPAPSDLGNAARDWWSEQKGLFGGAKGLVGANLGLDSMRDSGFASYQENMGDVAARQRPQY